MGAIIERRRNATVLRLDWPDVHNALGPPEASEIVEALRVAPTELGAALVLTGTGDFCAGGDLKQLTMLAAGPPEDLRDVVYGSFQGMIRGLLSIPVPTIAAIDGAAIGLGMDLALACDMRFVGPKGWLRQGWGGVGLIPGTGGALLLQRIVPSLLWRLLAEQPGVRADEASALGLAEPSPLESALASALERADHLALLPPRALSAYVDLQRASLREELDRHLAMCLEHQLELLGSDAFRERAQRILAGEGSDR
jgi:enoyl-CoA hydratase/carnithine racemase